MLLSLSLSALLPLAAAALVPSAPPAMAEQSYSRRVRVYRPRSYDNTRRTMNRAAAARAVAKRCAKAARPAACRKRAAARR